MLTQTAGPEPLAIDEPFEDGEQGRVTDVTVDLQSLPRLSYIDCTAQLCHGRTRVRFAIIGPRLVATQHGLVSPPYQVRTRSTGGGHGNSNHAGRYGHREAVRAVISIQKSESSPVHLLKRG